MSNVTSQIHEGGQRIEGDMFNKIKNKIKQAINKVRASSTNN